MSPYIYNVATPLVGIAMLPTSENPNVMNGCGSVRCCAVEIEACLPAGEFQNLHVAHVGSVDG